MKKFFLLITLTICVAAYKGFQAGSARPASKEILTQEVNSDVSDEKSLAHAMARVITSQDENPEARFKQLVDEQNKLKHEQNEDAAFAQAEQQLHPTERKVHELLGDSETGKRLKKILMTTRHGEAIPGSAALQGKYIAELKQNPDASYHDMVRAYDSLEGPEFSLERSTLIFLMHSMPGHEADANSVASRSLSSAGPDNFDAVLQSHALMIRSAPSAREALFGTVDAISAQSNELNRAMMANYFIEQHPEKAAELKEELERKGISLTLSAE